MYKHKPSPFDEAVKGFIDSRQVTKEEAELLVVEGEKRRFTHKEQREFQKRVKQYSRPGKSQSEAEKSAVKNIMNSRPLRDYIHRTTSRKRQ